MTTLAVLDYAGRPPRANRSILSTLARLAASAFYFVVLLVYVTVRGAILLAGLILVLAGTTLLCLGGKKGAARKLAAWRDRAADLLRLWISDILRPLRRQRLSPS